MIKLSETYANKVDSCVKAVKALGYEIEKIIRAYGSEIFPEGPEKKRCFEEVVRKELSEEVYEYMEDKCSLAHHRDSRLPYEYGVDLILGWLIEDAIILLLEEKGKKAILSGHDRFREFLHPRKISTQPDIKFMGKSGPKTLEIFSDWKGTWRTKDHADLRDNKFKKLKEHETVMVGIAPLTDEGFIMDFAKGNYGFEESFIPAYRKLGYTCKGIRAYLRPLGEVVTDLLAL